MKTTDEFEYKLRKDANTSRTLAFWSFTGLIIPILGWILGSVALSKSNSLPLSKLDDELVKIKNTAKKAAIISLVLSTIVFVALLVLSVVVANEAKQNSIEAAKQQKEQAKEQCLRKAADLGVPVREQQSNEDFQAYLNYVTSTNSKEINARQVCFDEYGY